jgi:small basic protein
MAKSHRLRQREATRAVWWLPVLGLLIGIMLGLAFSVAVPGEYSRYTAMAILAAMDSIFGAVRAQLEGRFDNRLFLSGFFVNIILASALTLLGDRLGVELYIAAIVAFGVRGFDNLAKIRRQLIQQLSGPRTAQEAQGD